MHWPECGVASIWRSSAFISSSVRRRPARTLPWQAMVAQTWSMRSCRTRPASSERWAWWLSRMWGGFEVAATLHRLFAGYLEQVMREDEAAEIERRKNSLMLHKLRTEMATQELSQLLFLRDLKDLAQR